MANNSERLLGNRWAAPAWMQPMLREAAEEIERLRITDDEKKAIEAALGWCDDRDTKTISTLNGLLKRLK